MSKVTSVIMYVNDKWLYDLHLCLDVIFLLS